MVFINTTVFKVHKLAYTALGHANKIRKCAYSTVNPIAIKYKNLWLYGRYIENIEGYASMNYE